VALSTGKKHANFTFTLTTMEPTVKLFSDDWLLLESAGTIVGIEHAEEGNGGVIMLDRTSFHPQGGGQPCDVGRIECGGKTFTVSAVRIDDKGVISHIGEFAVPEGEAPSFAFEVGKTANCFVEKRRRVVSTKLHSVGHLLDAALDCLGYSKKFIPGKGYHFEDSPYVEYKAAPDSSITPAELEALPAELDSKIAELISASIPTEIKTASREEAALNCRMDLSAYPDTVRVVTLAGFSIPCGGTHVANTQELGEGWKIGKIKKKKDMFRVPYSCSTLWQGGD